MIILPCLEFILTTTSYVSSIFLLFFVFAILFRFVRFNQ